VLQKNVIPSQEKYVGGLVSRVLGYTSTIFSLVWQGYTRETDLWYISEYIAEVGLPVSIPTPYPTLTGLPPSYTYTLYLGIQLGYGRGRYNGRVRSGDMDSGNFIVSMWRLL